MSSFVKIKKDDTPGIEGVRNSARNGKITSSGCGSLDFVLGGGLEVSSMFLIGEDKYSRHSNVLTKLFLADGFQHNHIIYFANLEDDPGEIVCCTALHLCLKNRLICSILGSILDERCSIKS